MASARSGDRVAAAKAQLIGMAAGKGGETKLRQMIRDLEKNTEQNPAAFLLDLVQALVWRNPDTGGTGAALAALRRYREVAETKLPHLLIWLAGLIDGAAARDEIERALARCMATEKKLTCASYMDYHDWLPLDDRIRLAGLYQVCDPPFDLLVAKALWTGTAAIQRDRVTAVDRLARLVIETDSDTALSVVLASETGVDVPAATLARCRAALGRMTSGGWPQVLTFERAEDPRDRERGSVDVRCRFRRDLFADRPSFDPARATAPGHAAATVLRDPLGTASGRTARLRPVVPLVRRARHRRPRLGRLDLLEEP